MEDSYFLFLIFGGWIKKTYTYDGINNVTLGNTTFKRAAFTAVTSGVTLNQYYYVKSFDKYVFSIIVTTTTEDVETIEAMFN